MNAGNHNGSDYKNVEVAVFWSTVLGLVPISHIRNFGSNVGTGSLFLRSHF